MPKYWLDGIFDEEIIEIKDEDFIPSEKYNGPKDGYGFKLGKNGIGYYRISSIQPIIGNKYSIQPIIENKSSVREMILCKNFKYCSKYDCRNRHWYNVLPCFSERMNELKTNSEYCKNDEIQALDRAIVRYKRQGYSVIVK
jgi:hypothetical protein